MRIPVTACVLLVVFVLDFQAQTYAQQWCAFAPKQKSRMQCGYSSPEQCREAVSGIGGVCVPDPHYAKGAHDRDHPPPL